MKKPKKPASRSSANPWPRRLKALRVRLGLTQVAMARRLHISQSQVSSYESGQRQPTEPIAYLVQLLETGKI